MLISVSALTMKDLKDLVTEPRQLSANQDVNEHASFKKNNTSVMFPTNSISFPDFSKHLSSNNSLSNKYRHLLMRFFIFLHLHN